MRQRLFFTLSYGGRSTLPCFSFCSDTGQMAFQVYQTATTIFLPFCAVIPHKHLFYARRFKIRYWPTRSAQPLRLFFHRPLLLCPSFTGETLNPFNKSWAFKKKNICHEFIFCHAIYIFYGIRLWVNVECEKNRRKRSLTVLFPGQSQSACCDLKVNQSKPIDRK